MSEKRLKRRQFLADALFAGGALGAAALATRWFTQPEAEPASPPPIAKVEPTPQPKPRVRPTPRSVPEPQPIPREDLNIQGGMRMVPNSETCPAPVPVPSHPIR